MLAYIRSNYKAGDSIEVTTSEGIFTGLIEYVSNKYIVLRLPNGQICGIADTDIRTFRADRPDNPVIPQDLVPPSAIEAAASAAQEEAAEDVVTTRDIENAEGADALTGPETSLSEPKVIGKIDLDSLKRIDPKFSRRTYFKPAEQGEQEGTAGDEPQVRYQRVASSGGDYTRGGYVRKPFVQAKGRITYYNPEKRFGFIHDYQSDNDLYFSQQQVADYDLYDHLQKGTKVAYSPSRNQQGYVALCVHLPHTVEDLLTMAEDYFNARHYFLARGLVEHALEVIPGDKEALALLDEIQSATAAARQNSTSLYKRDTGANPALYSACPTYAEAKKAYLDKDYARAETLYLAALEKEEKVDSCIKDLVTLYVSQFKQAQTDTERSEARDRAEAFLNSHRELLPDNLTTKQFLTLNYYLPMQEYEKFLQAVDELMSNPQIAESMSRRVFYIWQKGIALNKLGRAEEALALVEQGLQIAPHSRQLQNLRNMILHPEEYQSESPAGAGDIPVTADDEAAPAASSPEAEEGHTDPTTETGRPQSDDWWESLKHPMA